MTKRSNNPLIDEAIKLAKQGDHKQAMKLLEPYKANEYINKLYSAIQADMSVEEASGLPGIWLIVIALLFGVMIIYAGYLLLL